MRLCRAVRRPTRRLGVVAAVVGLTAFITACAGERPVLLEDASAVDAGAGRALTTDTNPASIEIEDPVVVPSQELAADNGLSDTAGDDAGDDAGEGVELIGGFERARGGVKAVITRTGVVVPVLGRTEAGYVVETPCGTETEINWGHPLGQVQVVLDPGHGGSERGALADNGLTEAELNLRVAQRTALLLQDRDIAVALTRTGDYRVPVRQRARLADALEADAVLSLHHNTPRAAASTGPGTEVYTQSSSLQSARLGGVLYEEVVAALSSFDVDWVSRADAGVLTVIDDDGEDAFGINRHTEAVNALVELGYLANPAEATLFETEEYLEAVATALADGIERYLTSPDPGSGYVDAPRVFNPSDETGGAEGCVGPVLE